jgi:hypothetical protein
MTTDRYEPIQALRRVVDELTQEHTVTVDQKGVYLGIRNEQALLLKLRVAVASNVGGGEGAGKAGRERVPLNVGARDLYDRITSDITEWYGRETDYAEGHGRPTPEVTLRQWYIRFVSRYRSNQVTDGQFDRQIGLVESWVTQIRDLLDPPFRFPLTAPCPICGLEWVSVYKADDPAEIERVRVLNAVERESIEESYVLCRNPECGRIWKGVMEARALRTLIDDAELRKASA